MAQARVRCTADDLYRVFCGPQDPNSAASAGGFATAGDREFVGKVSQALFARIPSEVRAELRRVTQRPESSKDGIVDDRRAA